MNQDSKRDSKRDYRMGEPVELIGLFERSNRRYFLLTDVVTLDGVPFRDHLWLRLTKRFRRLRLRKGQSVHLKAVVNRYQRKNGSWDINVQFISKMKAI